MRTAVAIKSWIAQTPSVEEVRPVRCAGCGAASRPVGGSLNVHGQGLMQRQVRGVLEVDGARDQGLDIRGCVAGLDVAPFCTDLVVPAAPAGLGDVVLLPEGVV